jgi:hypothetical protein
MPSRTHFPRAKLPHDTGILPLTPDSIPSSTAKKAAALSLAMAAPRTHCPVSHHSPIATEGSHGRRRSCANSVESALAADPMTRGSTSSPRPRTQLLWAAARPIQVTGATKSTKSPQHSVVVMDYRRRKRCVRYSICRPGRRYK